MARFKKGDDLNQQFLLPPSIRDWLPEDHLAWFIDETVEQLDIDSLSDSYRFSGKGELPYHPRTMVRILLYAYCTGTFSSRKIAKQLTENVAYRVLSRNQFPSHRSIRRFRQDHLETFEGLFVQVVRIAVGAGLARLGTLAIDGTKVKANASKHRAMSYDRMLEEEKRLRREIRAIAKAADDIDASEDVEFGPDFRGDELPDELARRESRLKKIREAKRRLEERKAQEAQEEEERRAKKAQDEGRDPPKRRKRKYPFGKPRPKDQENFTDSDSRLMMASAGLEQCFNAQIGVDADHQLIVAATVSSCGADNRLLLPMIETASTNTRAQPTRTLADAGYKSEDNLRGLEERELDAYVSVGRERPDSKPSRPERPATTRMRAKLNTKRGRERYRKRKHVVEPVVGWIKNVLGFRSFSLRGLSSVAGEWNLVCLAINVRRLHTMMQWG